MKIVSPRLLETAKLLETQAGQQLQDLITYVTSTFYQVVTALRNSLSFADNFNSMVWSGTLTHGVPQLINTTQKQPVQIVPGQVISTTYGFQTIVWSMDSNFNLIVTPYFGPSVPTQALGASLVILF